MRPKRISRNERLRKREEKLKQERLFWARILKELKETGPPKPPPLPKGLRVEDIPLPKPKKICRHCKLNPVKRCVDCFRLNCKILPKIRYTYTYKINSINK